ncbi:unnamed protein product [Schistosoma margrebowiei]|uniref:Cell wall protein IFF6-like n=1 Tax=Schistosoma margrebowiei TaxID=48269 RepID=A0AA85ANS7_9TREM|nr:unnamed protein product [Schistosoma margrebowiei]
MYSRKLFYCNSGVYMIHFIFYAIFMSVILTTGNANDSFTSSASESTDNLSDTTLSSTTLTQTDPSATTSSTETADVAPVPGTDIDVTGKTSTSTPMGSEGTRDTSSSTDNVSSESSDTELNVTRQSNKSVIANVVGEESLDVRTTESESSVSLMTSTTEIVSSSMESEQEKYRTTVTTTDNPKIVTRTPGIMNGVSSLKVFHILQLLIIFTLYIVYC